MREARFSKSLTAPTVGVCTTVKIWFFGYICSAALPKSLKDASIPAFFGFAAKQMLSYKTEKHLKKINF